VPNLEFPLPATIGEAVLIGPDALAGQVGMVMGWRVTRPRFLLGGLLDRPLQIALEVILEDGQELWLDAAEVMGPGASVSFFLPVVGGDQVRVLPSGTRGEVVGWEVVGRRLQVDVAYRVRLAGTPFGEEVEVDASDLELRTE
jgi:hypothetical protein